VGPSGQPDYINAVVRLDTRLSPQTLLEGLQAVERKHGRRRDGARWGPRTLDLDILLYGSECLDKPGLRIPHPELARRAFVLAPLADVAPSELCIPELGTLVELLQRCHLEGVTRLRDP
jgi:2-amino-4-hydroxy-6-hydroxymethyldihydropteridine diphosphokinase